MGAMNSNWVALVRSDVYAGSVNEDGERPDELAFYVVCENELGDRFASHMSFTTEDHFPSSVVDGVLVLPAEKLAEKFLVKVREALAAGADPSKSAKWSRTFPMYGSEAYARYGAAMERAADL